MPRTARASVGGVCYHVINRGNGRARVFHKDRDFQAFTDLFEPACERLPMRILAWCLIPNHFHLVVWPLNDGDLSRWMQWLLTAHVRRYHQHHRTSRKRCQDELAGSSGGPKRLAGEDDARGQAHSGTRQ